jgi:dipeptidyl aminopeptidase/acylaminoacyl peptidase
MPQPAPREIAPTRPLPALACLLAVLAALVAAPPARARGAQGSERAPFTLEEVLSYPYAYPAASAADADRIAWKVFERGARNLWSAAAPGFEPVQLTAYTEDDGQNLGDLQLTPDGATLVYTRGNGPNRAGEHANPSSDPEGAESAIWAVATDGGGAPRRLTGGHGAALSPDGARLLFLRSGGKVYEIELDGAAGEAASGRGEAASERDEPAAEGEDSGDHAGGEDGTKPRVLFEVRSGADSLAWSPDGRRVAFASDRGDHSFVGVYDREAGAITWLAPSVDRDGFPTWSPDGTRIAFVRFPGRRTGELFDLTGATRFSLWVADAATGEGAELWASPPDAGGFAQYYPAAPLSWVGAAGGGGRILFTSEHTGWLHVHALPAPAAGATAAATAEPVDLTPGECEAEASAVTPDGATLIVSGNCGDLARRHLWRVPTAGGAARAVTTGDGIETDPVVLAGGALLAFRHATSRRPQEMIVARLDGTEPRSLGPELPPSFPVDALVVPEEVTLTASDGLELHAQLFLPPKGAAGRGDGARRPATLFLHGGPIRQMLPGFHYSDYYARTYAMNQYLASRGYVALALNFRSGVGYGAAFRRAEGQGPRGATEYRDVLAAGLYLRRRADVDPERIGLWGGSYGGYLTALALARDSDLFAAGVDLHGVHDWALRARELSPGGGWGLSDELLETALRSSPVADLSTWSSPVLLIHGDDDRNVLFAQTTDLAQRLREREVPVEVLVFPDEVHGFLRHASWLTAYGAAVRFFDRYLGGAGGG